MSVFDIFQVLVLLKDFPGSRHLLKKAHKMCEKNEEEQIKIYETYKAGTTTS